jgi:hypothetical protein
MNIYANHVPVVEALNPGVIEVIEDSGSQGKKWFSESSFPSCLLPVRTDARHVDVVTLCAWDLGMAMN